MREVGAQADQPPATPRDILLKEGEEGHGSDATTKASNGVSQSVSPWPCKQFQSFGDDWNIWIYLFSQYLIIFVLTHFQWSLRIIFRQ